jgi:hypothetical protein
MNHNSDRNLCNKCLSYFCECKKLKTGKKTEHKNKKCNDIICVKCNSYSCECCDQCKTFPCICDKINYYNKQKKKSEYFPHKIYNPVCSPPKPQLYSHNSFCKCHKCKPHNHSYSHTYTHSYNNSCTCSQCKPQSHLPHIHSSYDDKSCSCPKCKPHSHEVTHDECKPSYTHTSYKPDCKCQLCLSHHTFTTDHDYSKYKSDNNCSSYNPDHYSSCKPNKCHTKYNTHYDCYGQNVCEHNLSTQQNKYYDYSRPHYNEQTYNHTISYVSIDDKHNITECPSKEELVYHPVCHTKPCDNNILELNCH